MSLSIAGFDVPLQEYTFVRNIDDEKNIEKQKGAGNKKNILRRVLRSEHFADTLDVPTCVKVVLCRRRAGVGQLAVVGV